MTGLPLGRRHRHRRRSPARPARRRAHHRADARPDRASATPRSPAPPTPSSPCGTASSTPRRSPSAALAVRRLARAKVSGTLTIALGKTVVQRWSVPDGAARTYTWDGRTGRRDRARAPTRRRSRCAARRAGAQPKAKTILVTKDHLPYTVQDLFSVSAGNQQGLAVHDGVFYVGYDNGDGTSRIEAYDGDGRRRRDARAARHRARGRARATRRRRACSTRRTAARRTRRRCGRSSRTGTTRRSPTRRARSSTPSTSPRSATTAWSPSTTPTSGCSSSPAPRPTTGSRPLPLRDSLATAAGDDDPELTPRRDRCRIADHRHPAGHRGGRHAALGLHEPARAGTTSRSTTCGRDTRRRPSGASADLIWAGEGEGSSTGHLERRRPPSSVGAHASNRIGHARPGRSTSRPAAPASGRQLLRARRSSSRTDQAEVTFALRGRRAGAGGAARGERRGGARLRLLDRDREQLGPHVGERGGRHREALRAEADEHHGERRVGRGLAADADALAGGRAGRADLRHELQHRRVPRVLERRDRCRAAGRRPACTGSGRSCRSRRSRPSRGSARRAAPRTAPPP